VEAIGAAILTVTITDARGFFEHCGYRLDDRLLGQDRRHMAQATLRWYRFR
jgi:hypothetical protein